MNVQDTCTTKCKFWKKYKEGCPFYMETLWAPNEGSGQPKVVKDCAPKRSVLLQMEASNVIGGLHTASNQERNMQRRVVNSLLTIISNNPLIDDLKNEDFIDAKLIEEKDESSDQSI